MQMYSSIGAAPARSETEQKDDMQFHPVAELFPLMSGEPFEEFCADVRVNGLREDIFVAADPVDGVVKIADGRNRFNACTREGVGLRYRHWDGHGDLTAIVVSLNLRRRHLTESQRAMVAGKLATMRQGERNDLSEISGKLSQTTAAEMFNVSTDSVGFAKKVLDSGEPELVEWVESEGLAVSAAARIAVMPEGKRKKIIKKGRLAAKQILTNLKTQSLRQTAKGYGTCIYCNPELELTDAVISAFAQRVEQRCKEALRAGRATGNYGPLFENISFEIEDAKRAAAVEGNYEKIFAVIDGSPDTDDHQHQVAEKTDIQRITRIPWQEFNDTVAEMLYYKLIEAVEQGGKGETARGARKTLYRRAPKPDGDLTYEIDEDLPEEDIYYDRFEDL